MRAYTNSFGMHAFAALCLFMVNQSDLQALVIEAEADIWIRESAPGTAYPDDLISVWDGVADDQRRHGIVVFDLSSTIENGTPIDIESVYLELFDRNDSQSQYELVQQAFLMAFTPQMIDPNYNWEEYALLDEPTEQALQSLGAYNIPENDTLGGYQASDLASQADINLLETTRDSVANNNRVAFVLKAVAGRRDWGDIEYDGTPPRLVINQPVSVFGDFTGDQMVDLADYEVLTAAENWLDEVPVGTRGDITGDGFVSLDDFKAFKTVYLQNNPGQSLSFGTAVPEPSSLVILVAAFVVALAVRGRGRVIALVGTFRNVRAQGLPTREYACVPATRGRSPKGLLVATAMLATMLMTTAAEAVVLEAVSDVWIRERSPDSTYEGDLVSVWSSLWTNQFEDPGLSTRYGIIEFDLGAYEGVDLTTATLQLWGGAHGSGDEVATIKQSAFVIDTSSGTPATSLTWNSYQSEYAATAVPLEELGRYDLEEPTDTDVFFNSMASSDDLAKLEAIADGSMAANRKLTLVLVAEEDGENAYGHSWGDGPDGYAGMDARLLLNELPPEVVELTLEVDRSSGRLTLMNPGVDPLENTTFEIDGYVISSPAGTLNPDDFTGLTGAGHADWDIVDPTATALSEVSLTSTVVLEEGDSIILGEGFMIGAAEDPEMIFGYSLADGGIVQGNIVYVGAATTGDFNGDGAVNLADYTVWRDNLGKTDASIADGDADANGVVDATDYGIWKSSFGSGLSATAAVQTGAVPEPTSIVLVSLLIAPVAYRFGRNRAFQHLK